MKLFLNVLPPESIALLHFIILTTIFIVLLKVFEKAVAI